MMLKLAIIIFIYAIFVTILAIAEYLHIKSQDKEIAKLKKLDKIFFESTFENQTP